MINKMAMEMTSELIPEMIPELTGDPDGCPLTDNTTWTASMNDGKAKILFDTFFPAPNEEQTTASNTLISKKCI